MRIFPKSPFFKGGLFNGLRFIGDLVGALAFLTMFAAFILQVFTRYVLNDPLGWTSELCVIAFIWVAFWGAGLMTRERDQIRFDLFYQLAAPGVRRIMALIAAAALAIIFLFALPGNYDFVRFMATDRTWVLEIRFDYVFAVFIVFMLAFALRCLWRVWRLLGRDWRDEL